VRVGSAVLIVLVLAASVIWFTRDVESPDDDRQVVLKTETDVVPMLRGRPMASKEPAGAPADVQEPNAAGDPPPDGSEKRTPVTGQSTALHIVRADERAVVGRVAVLRGREERWVWIEPDATVRFPTDRSVGIRIVLDDGTTRALQLAAGSASVDVVFGSGEIAGIVRDQLGLPQEGVAVTLTTMAVDEVYRPSAQGLASESTVVTDRDGAYRFGGLPRGTFIVVARRSARDAAAGRNIRSVKVTLERAESRRLDFGDVKPEPLWTGRVVYADGAVVLRSLNLFMTREEGGGRLYVHTDAQGRFSQRLPPGVYGVELVIPIPHPASPLGGGMRLVPSTQRIDLTEGDLEVDVTFRGRA